MKAGIDLGGTKIEILVIDDSGKELLRNRVATPKDNYQEIIDVITALIKNAEEYLEQECSIGICTPGSLSIKTGLLRNSNTVCLNGKPFEQDLEASLARQIRIANDANCFVLSEAIDGAAHNAKTVFGVIVGTGVGGGLVINKKVLIGANAIAGEWGHNPLPWSDDGELNLTKCWCGLQGCIETFLSGPGLECDYARAVGKHLSAEKIVELASQDDVAAEQTILRYEQRMARALAHIVNIFDPEVIVLGGGMSNVKRLYENVPNLWQQWIFSDHISTKLVSAKYGDASGVRGAAWLWENN
ncbi:MAG: ROK family protein [Gammaproteobacteria bacterium]|nr:MAG: ROK family protein [Gammaproteobacteria bacterium]